MQPSLTELAEKLGLAILGQALPGRPALRHVLRHTWMVIFLGVLSGVLAAVFIAFMLFGGYYVLVAEGLSSIAAFAVIACILLLTLGITSLLTMRCIDRFTAYKEDKSALSEEKRAELSPTEELTALLATKGIELLEAFWDGIQQADAASRPDDVTQNDASQPDAQTPDKGRSDTAMPTANAGKHSRDLHTSPDALADKEFMKQEDYSALSDANADDKSQPGQYKI